jgi:hypothetical protein
MSSPAVGSDFTSCQVAAEQSFSCMRRIRTYVRSSKKEDRLSALSNINIENDLAKNIDLDELVDIFSRMPNLRDYTGVLGSDNARRLQL